MILGGNKAKRFSPVNHTTKTTHHHHRYHPKIIEHILKNVQKSKRVYLSILIRLYMINYNESEKRKTDHVDTT